MQIDPAIRKIIIAARVHLRRPQILLIEEDFLTLDKFRDHTIYGKFWKMEATIVSILSDLKNVLLYDRVYILNQGSVLESGSPNQLIGDKNSALYQRLLNEDQKTFRSIVKTLQVEAAPPKKPAAPKKKTVASKNKLNN